MPVMKRNQVQNSIFHKKNAELNKQWIRFVNKKDWLATKNLMLRELYFEEKYLW